jgi:hypothetical protein
MFNLSQVLAQREKLSRPRAANERKLSRCARKRGARVAWRGERDDIRVINDLREISLCARYISR